VWKVRTFHLSQDTSESLSQEGVRTISGRNRRDLSNRDKGWALLVLALEGRGVAGLRSTQGAAKDGCRGGVVGGKHDDWANGVKAQPEKDRQLFSSIISSQGKICERREMEGQQHVKRQLQEKHIREEGKLNNITRMSQGYKEILSKPKRSKKTREAPLNLSVGERTRLERYLFRRKIFIRGEVDGGLSICVEKCEMRKPSERIR